MGFYIKYNDIRCLKNYTNAQFSTWQEEFNIIVKRLQAIVNLESYKGKTAESSKQYVNEVHTLHISSIIKAIADYQTKALLYSNGYYDNIDVDKDTIIVEEILDTVKNKFNTGRENFEFESNRLEAKIRGISDLLYVPVPSTYSIFDNYANIDTRIRELTTKITTYEQNKMNTDLAALENLIRAVKATIKGYLKKGYKEVAKYKTGDFVKGETIADLVTQINISMDYSEHNSAEIATAIEKDNSIHMEIQAEIQAQRQKEYDEYVKEMAKIRKNKGIVKIISSAAIMIAGGAAIVLTAGAATPVVFTMAGTAALSTTASVAITVAGTATTIYGASEMYEGYEDFNYGSQGDIETISFNPVRDIAFAGNQTAYDVWGKLNLTFTMVAMPVYSAVNTAVTTPGAPIVRTVVKELSKELAVDTMAGIAANETTKYIADRHDLSQSSQVLLNMGLNIFSQLGVRVAAGDFNIGKSSKDSSVAQTAEDIAYGKHWDDLEMGIHSNTPGMDAVDAAKYQVGLGKLDAYISNSKVNPNEILDIRKVEIGKTKGLLSGVEWKDAGAGGSKSVDGIIEGGSNFGKYSTKIDSRVSVVDKQELPSWLGKTFKDNNYRTVVINEDITVYRSFGYNADAGGAFATSSPALNRVQVKVDSAILPEWKNTLKYEAEIVIPKGTTLNIGRVEEQITMSGTRLAGDADQFLLPENWDLSWIKSIKEVKP